MKTFAAILTLIAGAGLSHGQPVVVVTHTPGQVSFQNSETSRFPSALKHLVTNIDGTLLVGTQFKAELYYLDTDTGSLTPIAATLSSFRLPFTSVPGTWSGPAPYSNLPDGYGGVDLAFDGEGNLVEAGDGTGTGAGYYPVTLAVRVWDSTTGNSYETATTTGSSANFVYTQRSSYPPAVSDLQMLTQPGFQLQVVPEPRAFALIVFGVMAVFLLRRRSDVETQPLGNSPTVSAAKPG